MIQDILTHLAFIAAIGYTLYSTWKTLFSQTSKTCGGGCPSCEAKNLLIRELYITKK